MHSAKSAANRAFPLRPRLPLGENPWEMVNPHTTRRAPDGYDAIHYGNRPRPAKPHPRELTAEKRSRNTSETGVTRAKYSVNESEIFGKFLPWEHGAIPSAPPTCNGKQNARTPLTHIGRRARQARFACSSRTRSVRRPCLTFPMKVSRAEKRRRPKPPPF